MEEQTVLFNPEKKTFCVLNETAAFLWEALSDSSTDDELLEALSEAFDVSDAAAAKLHLEEALSELVGLDLVDAVP